MRVTGCIVRIWHQNDNVLSDLGSRFIPDHHNVRIERQHGHPTMLYHERLGNLDVAGWLSSVARDLEELEADDFGFGTSLRVGIELVMAP